MLMSNMRTLINIVKEGAAMPISFDIDKTAPSAALPEHSLVRAVKEIHDCGNVVPVGSTGAIIDVFKEGYTIEFTKPEHIIASASRDAIDPL